MRFVRENLFYVILAAVVVIGSGVAIFYYIGSDIGNSLDSRQRLSGKLKRLANQKPKVNISAVTDMKDRIERLKKANEGDFQACLKFNRESLPVMRLKVSEASSEPAFPVDAAKYGAEGLYLRFFEEYTRQIDQAVSPRRQGLLPTVPPTAQEIEAERIKLAEKFTDAVEAGQKARQSVKLSKTENSLIYVDPDAVDRYFPRRQSRAVPDVNLWEAQVNLWVTNEIIQAIITTNQQWLAEQQSQGTPAVAPSVTRSAIKRLVKVTVEESIAPVATVNVSQSMTQRKTCAEYAVVSYKFTVIMPTRHVRRLIRSLETQNYHTVTNLNMTKVGPTDNELFYYGVEPVMKVEIKGELLLLADWIRPLLPAQLAAYMPGASGK